MPNWRFLALNLICCFRGFSIFIYFAGVKGLIIILMERQYKLGLAKMKNNDLKFLLAAKKSSNLKKTQLWKILEIY